MSLLEPSTRPPFIGVKIDADKIRDGLENLTNTATNEVVQFFNALNKTVQEKLEERNQDAHTMNEELKKWVQEKADTTSLASIIILGVIALIVIIILLLMCFYVCRMAKREKDKKKAPRPGPSAIQPLPPPLPTIAYQTAPQVSHPAQLSPISQATVTTAPSQASRVPSQASQQRPPSPTPRSSLASEPLAVLRRDPEVIDAFGSIPLVNREPSYAKNGKPEENVVYSNKKSRVFNPNKDVHRTRMIQIDDETLRTDYHPKLAAYNYGTDI